jgi:hypothetical protein
MRKARKSPTIPGAYALIFIAAVVTGLHVAESGVNALRGCSDPLLFDLEVHQHGDLEVTVFGMPFELRGSLVICGLETSPDHIVLTRGESRLGVPLRFLIPGSDTATRAVKKLVLQATEAGFSASRAIYRWWESRQ